MSFQRLRPPTDDSSHYDGDGGDHHDDGGCDDNDYYDYDDDCYDDDHLSVGDYNYELSQDRDYPFGPGNDDYYNNNGPPGYSGPPPRPGFTFRRGRPSPPQPGFPFKRGRPGPPQPDFPFRRGRPGPSQPDFPSRGGPPGPHQPDFPFRGGPHQPDFPSRGGPPGPHQPDFPFRGGPHQPDFPFRGGPHQPDFPFRGGPHQPDFPFRGGPHQPDFPFRGGPHQPDFPFRGGPHQPDFPFRGGPHQPDFPFRGGPPGPHQPDFPSRGGPPGPSLRRFPNRRDQAPRANLINIQAHGDIPRHTFDSYVTQKGAIERQKLLQDLSQKQIKVASLKAEMGKLVREQNEIMQQTGVVNANLPQLNKIETVMASLTEEVEGLLKASFCTPTCEKINVSEETRGKEPPTKKQKPLVTEKCKVSAKSKIAKEKLAGQEQVTPVVDVPSGRMNLPCVEINSDKFHERSFPVVESATKISDAGGISSVVKSGSAQMNSGLYGDSILPAADSARTNSSTKAGSEAEKSKDVAANVGDHAAMGQWRLPPIAQSYKQSQPYQHVGDSHGQASVDSTYSSSHSKAGDMKSQAIDDADIKQEKGSSKSRDKQRSSSSHDDRMSSCDGHPCENLASSRVSHPRDDRTPAHGSHSHGTELKSILKKKTGEERVDAESKASSVTAGEKKGKDSELPDIQGQLNNQLGLRSNRSSKVWQVASKEQAVSQVNHLFQDTGQAHNLASSSQAKKAGDNDDEELYSTVQNILQSIGFNSALSKRMQELVHQKKQQQDVLHTGMIKQSASSLGHSEQFAQDVMAASCSDKQEKMLRVRMTTRYGRGRSAEAHRGQAGNSRKGVSPELNGGRSRMGLESHEIRSERPLNNSKYQDHEEVSPDEDEMGGMEPNGGRSRMGLESHEIRSERPLNNSKYQDWEEISPDEDEMGGVESRKIIEPIRSLSCAKHAEIRLRSFSRERAVTSPPHSKVVLDETRKSKMMLCESQEKSVSLSERFEDEPKGTYFDSDDSESTKAAALLAAVLSSKFWGSISSSGSKSLTLPLQSGPARVENLRVTYRTVHSDDDDDEPYIESRKVILPSKSDVRIVSRSPVFRKSQSPEMKVPRKRPASPLLFPVSKERRDFSEKGSYSDLNALLIRSLEDIAPEICQALCLGVGSFNNSSLSQAVLGGLIVGGLPAAERAESPVMSDCFNRGIRRKLPDRQILRSPNGRTSRSPGRQLSRSPERRKSGSSDRLVSKSPYRIKSPDRLMSKSTLGRKSKSPYRRKSPDRLVSKSILRRKSKSPYRRKSPDRRKSISPSRRRSRSPYRHKSRSTDRRRSRSPDRRRSRSPDRRRSRSPDRRRSRSPYRHKSRSPDRRRSRSPDRQRSRILYESKRAPKKKTY